VLLRLHFQRAVCATAMWMDIPQTIPGSRKGWVHFQGQGVHGAPHVETRLELDFCHFWAGSAWGKKSVLDSHRGRSKRKLLPLKIVSPIWMDEMFFILDQIS
jgi:hypothetical protein